MSEKEIKKFLNESFSEGVYYRELRLSKGEVDALRELYPSAKVKKTTEVNDAQSKAWYEINLMPVQENIDHIDSVRKENLRLKRELKILKNQ
ncbi:hypothetical protein [Halobacillus yeomjeoni]|uniref:Uncharacterized protein n=1 Tax=Halobacillus yeomjeoni TaxID=311194 RepID=A0A931HVN6_9BACI|nr:hypothetical protein [Halobacillus yeomjeoni]MBH0230335.1 hypothetical protein [Halobacillus yeomjeoni]